MKAGDFFLVQFGHNDSKPQWLLGNPIPRGNMVDPIRFELTTSAMPLRRSSN